MTTLGEIRALRRELQTEAGGQHIWQTLLDRYSANSEVEVALALAYEIGYEDGERSAAADRMIEEDD